MVIADATRERETTNVRFPGESDEYRAARDRLLDKEIELRRLMEEVALLAFGWERDWQHLRLLSSAGNAYNPDYHAEIPEGHQRPMLNVSSKRP